MSLAQTGWWSRVQWLLPAGVLRKLRGLTFSVLWLSWSSWMGLTWLVPSLLWSRMGRVWLLPLTGIPSTFLPRASFPSECFFFLSSHLVPFLLEADSDSILISDSISLSTLAVRPPPVPLRGSPGPPCPAPRVRVVPSMVEGSFDSIRQMFQTCRTEYVFWNNLLKLYFPVSSLALWLGDIAVVILHFQAWRKAWCNPVWSFRRHGGDSLHFAVLARGWGGKQCLDCSFRHWTHGVSIFRFCSCHWPNGVYSVIGNPNDKCAIL